MREDKYVGYMFILYSDRHPDAQLCLVAKTKNKQVSGFKDEQTDRQEGRHADRQTEGTDRRTDSAQKSR